MECTPELVISQLRACYECYSRVADMDAGLCTAAYQRRVVFVRPGAGYTACSSSFPACEMLRVFDTVIIVRGKGHCKGSLLGIQPWRWIVHVALPKSLIQC